MTKEETQKEITELKQENKKLKDSLVKVCLNIGNGSFANKKSSLDFLCDCIPEEVRLYCIKLRSLQPKI